MNRFRVKIDKIVSIKTKILKKINAFCEKNFGVPGNFIADLMTTHMVVDPPYDAYSGQFWPSEIIDHQVDLYFSCILGYTTR